MTPPNKWLFFPTQTSGPLQTITWDMSSDQNATVSSTGTPIISTTKVSQLFYQNGKPRLWNGSEAANGTNFSGTAGSGANIQYKFTSGATCRQWWHLYSVFYSRDSGGGASTPVPMDAESDTGSGSNQNITGSVAGTCQPGYINTGPPASAKSGLEDITSDDTLVFYVYAV